MKTVLRSQIRHYIINLLREEVDVGGRVFACRPTSPIFLEELPSICVYFGIEENETWIGETFYPKEYRRHLPVAITIAAEDILEEQDTLNVSNRGDDYIDWLGLNVERVLAYDYQLARRLPDFDADKKFQGLTNGSKLDSTVPYEVETDTDRRIIGQTLRYIYPYITPVYLDLRLPDFKSFYAAITKVGVTDETVDPILIEMEGEFNGTS